MMEEARWPCWLILLQVLLQAGQNFAFQACVAALALILDVIDQLGAYFGKVLHEVERVLQLVGNARRELAQKSHFFGLHQLRLRLAQLAAGCAGSPAAAGR